MPNRRTAAALAVIAGVLLVLAHAQGATALVQLGDKLAITFLPQGIGAPVHLVLSVLLVIAGLGGVAVILGGVLVYKDLLRSGRLCIALGAGVGLLGMILLVFIALASSEELRLVGYLLGPAGLGVVLSILARHWAR
jgi:hypothetical protein